MPFKKKDILTLHVMKLVDKIWIKNGIMIFFIILQMWRIKYGKCDSDFVSGLTLEGICAA